MVVDVAYCLLTEDGEPSNLGGHKQSRFIFMDDNNARGG